MRMRVPRFAWKPIAIAVVLIAVGAVVGYALSHRMRQTPSAATSSAAAPQEDPNKTYLTLDAFASSTMQQAPGQLLEAFKKGSLLEAGSWDIPGENGAKLVAATPTLSGKREQIGCGDTHPLCGLYFVSPATTTLLVWGEPLRGFGGTHGFVDPDHARIWTAWSFQSYTVAEERALNVHDGSQASLDLLELDDNGPSSELTVTRGSNKTIVDTVGKDEKGRNIPTAIAVSINGKKVGSVAEDLLSHLATAAAAAPERAQAIGISETAFPDLQTGKMIITLYGKPFTLDPNTGELEPSANY